MIEPQIYSKKWFKAAARARFDYNKEQFYNEAKRYLTTSQPAIAFARSQFKSAFNVSDWTDNEADSVAQAFRDVCAEWLDKED